MTGTRLVTRQVFLPAPIRRFFDWWGRELEATRPRGLMFGLATPPRLLTLSMRDQHFDAQVERVPTFGSWIKVWVQTAIEPEAAATFFAELRHTYGPLLAARLIVPHDDCLILDRYLPAPASDQADKIAALEIERKTPFRRNEVYWNHRVEKAVGGSGQSRLQIFILKRSKLERVRGELHAVGIPLVQIAISDGQQADGLIELTDRSIDGPRPVGQRLDAAMKASALLCVVLFAIWLGTIFWQQRGVLAQLGGEVAAAQSAALKIKQERAAKDAVVERIVSLYSRKARRPLAAEIWEELAGTLPDSAWISELRIEETSATIDGYSRAAADLIAVFSRSKWVSRAAFAGPITRDPSSGSERFRIKIELRLTDTDRFAAGPENAHGGSKR